MKNSSLLLAYFSMEIVTGTARTHVLGRHGCSGCPDSTMKRVAMRNKQIP